MKPVYVWEIKTTSEDLGLGTVYWRRLTIDPQISIYIAAAKSLGFDVLGVMYDVLRKPAHRPSQAKSETTEAYGRRVLEAISDQPDRYYQRGLITRLESELDEARADTWQTATSIRDSRRLKVWPRHTDSCVQWSRVCDYFAVCCGEQAIDDPVLFQRNEKKHVELDGVCPECGHSPCLGSCWRTHAPPGVDTRVGLPKVELLTQSSLRTYRSCPRKYFYRYELQMRPLRAEAEPLRAGKSVHAALEAWSVSGGDLEFALTKLDQSDLYAYAREAAMMTGYHARWEKPTGVIAVEKEWQMELVNPETGAASRTFRLGGRMDKLVEAPVIQAPSGVDPDCECPDCFLEVQS